MKREQKRAKPYQETAKNTSKVEEPAVAYRMRVEPLDYLAQMSVQELDQVKLSGDALVALQQKTTLSPQALADVVGVSKSKYYELVRMDKLSSKNLDALADFATLWQKGIEAFDEDQSLLKEWLHTRNENLGGIRPVELLSSRMGRRELEKAFERIEYGTYG